MRLVGSDRQCQHRLECDGDELVGVVGDVTQAALDHGRRQGSSWGIDTTDRAAIEAWFRTSRGESSPLAVLLIGATVNFRRAQWTFGQLALEVDEERLIQVIAWVLQALAAAPAEPA